MRFALLPGALDTVPLSRLPPSAALFCGYAQGSKAASGPGSLPTLAIRSPARQCNARDLSQVFIAT